MLLVGAACRACGALEAEPLGGYWGRKGPCEARKGEDGGLSVRALFLDEGGGASEAGVEVDEGAVQAHCAGRLAKYKVPAKVVSLEAFPVTESANGIKIQRTKLREMALALVSS